ncbi:MAG: M28 family peptidase [Candidatus Bipolaricaulaceae bacterium]
MEVGFFVLVLIAVMVGLAKITHHLAGLLGLDTIATALLFGFGNSSPGAADSTSGVFAVIECLRRFGDRKDVNIVPVFFNYEEVGLLGSQG